MNPSDNLPPVQQYDGTAHIFRSDMQELQTGEKNCQVFSIPMGSPTHGETVPLFSFEYVQEYARATIAARQPLQISVDEFAALLTNAGWKDTGDAQWDGIENLMQKLGIKK